MEQTYDYIVTGGGAAGRSLICRLLANPELREKKILLIDRSPKRENDRTWCFWEKEAGFFEGIVFHSWDHIWVHTHQFSRLLDIAPYTYKLIRGIDFYQYTDDLIDRAGNVERYYGEVHSLNSTDKGVEVQVGDRTFSASWCFNSIFFGKIDKTKVNYLDQHFRGWFIKTDTAAFDPGQATLMDFRIPQHQETRFLYVLPSSPYEALVEIAIFSNNHLEAEAYDAILHDYVDRYLPGVSDFSIEQVEMGNIPMTDFSFPTHEGRVIHLGMAGGDTRASSGYTFFNIQRRVENIADCLAAGRSPILPTSWPERRASFYDKLMLRVLEQKYYPGSDLFEKLFAKNDPERVLAFLNAETSVFLEAQLVSSLPKSPFLRALIEI
ncbi:lycopene cyclase family protein [Flavilitoribacter nigricans]|uniref:Lycopene cyclase n=1 Tax=Flavilitoribacter nigricans (strain ATCC 23147 / DSM 23189 / NBRC 102662 / NCIMB 1420 / SS-2) TaxID=1122177 RepID=A0A2D0MXP5_FLAN2|nr:lycopene cyclase family protein [Flavilitoribacter nigricans]PHN00987.1 lycopene cyclase [Flavilitoribacter nigricans DSM 23189 = NBRC 102662]